jgi:hypothetical protein
MGKEILSIHIGIQWNIIQPLNPAIYSDMDKPDEHYTK